ncbi:unnamed protein product [Ceutorhynchus assimilis]|uniref:UDENN FNIP1/2-type domain-containing protein n=1 Tax=Ceutorhynchus assimilis TaxID=467358 RepID=A0A9N9MME7_9CUCU|nr:unnamed protein product [Ceutorhynchus assimilis]
MALFNKLFSGLKIVQQNCHDDEPISHRVSSFGVEQVRLVLFRECDFRGRKLLFDSNATAKIQLEKAETDTKFVEVCNGYGYLVVAKKNADYEQLSEMVFGSVAMSFRGTFLKIHSLKEPNRIMFTQVFPSPHSKRPKTSSTSSIQSHSSTQSNFEHSIKLDDSGRNSAFSTSDRLSDRSTASDTVLVYRRRQSIPLDVPGRVSSGSKNSLVVDSGCADQSFSSLSTGPLNFPTWESTFSNKDLSAISFSSSGIFRRLLRSSTRSLQGSSTSLPNSSEGIHKSHHQKTSKLGLTISIELPSGKEKFLTQFLMEHIALIESLIWRTHHSVTLAYHRPSSFISFMMEVAQSTAECDNSANLCRSFQNQTSDTSRDRSLFLGSFSGPPVSSTIDIMGFNFSKFLKTDSNKDVVKKTAENSDFVGDGFLKQFCELVEAFDVKDTNFFISTLLTAVLTHHLGWVATVFPPSPLETEYYNKNFKQPYNALWSQLTDLYGAIGHPVKTAQTVITGSNKINVSKLLSALTYFIRFSNVERKQFYRPYVQGENKTAELLCIKSNSISKQNYKKYEDHLKELLVPESPKPGCSSEEKPSCSQMKEVLILQAAKGLSKIKSSGGLAGLIPENPKLSKVASNLGNISVEADCDENQNKKSLAKSIKFNNLTLLEQKTENVENNNNCENNKSKNVIFVLGEDETLVGFKKDEDIAPTKMDIKVGSGAKRKVSLAKRPSSLNLSKTSYELFSENQSESICPYMHPSSSYESLCIDPSEKPSKNSNIRAQSEPPEIRKVAPYSRVKFNLQQYPQVVRNYMKSKNIELEGLSLGEKVFDKFATVQNNIKLDLSGYETDGEEVEALQTPSNASELEFSPDMGTDEVRDSREASPVGLEKLMKIVDIPMPKSMISDNQESSMPYTSTVIKGIVDTFIPDMALQGVVSSKQQWYSELKSNLAMNAQHSLLDQPVDEALAIVANTDTWEVQVLSSHTYVIDKGTNGVRAGMSQLVANMLESLLQMWKLNIPTQYCMLHIEQRLQELCVRSKALAEMLLSSEFCSIEMLTSTLRIEVNDVPLLMAVASTHSPEVTQKYGLSFH